jgi:hypothetical protein
MDPDATVVINPETVPAPGPAAPFGEDDMDATVIIGANGPPQEVPPNQPPGEPSPSDFSGDADTGATVVIQPDGQQPSSAIIPKPDDPFPNSEDDDIMEQTIIIRSGVKKE